MDENKLAEAFRKAGITFGQLDTALREYQKKTEPAWVCEDCRYRVGVLCLETDRGPYCRDKISTVHCSDKSTPTTQRERAAIAEQKRLLEIARVVDEFYHDLRMYWMGPQSNTADYANKVGQTGRNLHADYANKVGQTGRNLHAAKLLHALNNLRPTKGDTNDSQ